MYKTLEQNPVALKASDSAVDILRSTKAFIQNANKYNSYIVNHKNTDSPKREGSQFQSCRDLYRSVTKFSKETKLYNSASKVMSSSRFIKTNTNFLAITAPKQTDEDVKSPIDIFNAQAEIFNENNYCGKEYNCTEIYRKDDYYMEMIKRKILYFKTNANENGTSMLSKNFTKSKYFNSINQINLYSLEIRFVNPNDTRSEPISIYLPFSLLPIYYFVNFETFKLVLMSILEFNVDHSGIEIMYHQIPNILLKWNEFDTDQDFTFTSPNEQKFNWLTSKCIYDVYVR
jgi:hypothetical protein